MSKDDGIGARMKENYELPFFLRLPSRLPVIIRLDGKNFHSFTKDMIRPFDEEFITKMTLLTIELCEVIHTTQFAYCQSDEISLLLHPYKRLVTQPWLNNEVQKIASVSAGIASAYFSHLYEKLAVFDSRVFVLPESEVVNYFVWRQQDASRNSINMLAQSMYPHKDLLKKNISQIQDMMMEKQVNWNDLPTHKKRGFAVYKKDDRWKLDLEIPIFTKDREFIRKWLKVDED